MDLLTTDPVSRPLPLPVTAQPLPPARGRETLTGTVEIVTYHNDENGYSVLKCRVSGQKDLVPVLGYTPTVAPGEHVTAQGEWVIDKQYGRQFRAEFLRSDPPNSIEGMERFLASGRVRGIGPTRAKRLVKAFGAEVFSVLEDPPPGDEKVERPDKAGRMRLMKPLDTRRLLTVDGIGSVLADRIAAGWAEARHVREIMVFLHSHKVSDNKAARIYKRYGKDAIAKVQEDPYCLARDIRGIGFLSADKIAQNMGVPLDSPVRARAGITHVLGEATTEGHCGLPYGALVEQAVELLAIPQPLVVEAVEHEVEHGRQLQEDGGRDHPLGEGLIEVSVDGQRAVFLPSFHRAEQAVAHHVKRLRDAPLPWPQLPAARVDGAIQWVQDETKLTLADSQKAAIRLALASKLLIITGGPGTGKSTLLNSILKVLSAMKVRSLLCAPTGKAAKRITETTGREAKTIHRLLQPDPSRGPMGFKHHRGNPLDTDLLVVDESSMIDVQLMAKLLDAVGTGTAVIFVGDVDQLPSVGPGQVLVDMIDSGCIDTVRLTEVFRQAATSRIIRAAHAINHGHVPELPAKGEASDFHFFQVEEPAKIAEMVVELVRTFIPKRFGYDPIKDIQVLCPKKDGETGSRALNFALQEALNPLQECYVEKYGYKFGLRDKVMQIENDYDKDVYNGDVGTVVKIDHEETELVVDFDGKLVSYAFSELDELVLCYAFSVHKSQGSEYPVVVMPISTQHYTMLQRNLVYTGITRGKSMVICVGTTKAMAIAARTKVTGRRFSNLIDWLQQLAGRPEMTVRQKAPPSRPAADDDPFGLN